MPNYRVGFSRTLKVYESTELVVKAPSSDEAETIAMREFSTSDESNYKWREDESETIATDIVSCEEVKK